MDIADANLEEVMQDASPPSDLPARRARSRYERLELHEHPHTTVTVREWWCRWT